MKSLPENHPLRKKIAAREKTSIARGDEISRRAEHEAERKAARVVHRSAGKKVKKQA